MTDRPTFDNLTTGTDQQHGELLAALAHASALVEAVPATVESTRPLRDALRTSIDDHLVTRLRHPELPALVAVAGLGGVGKSYLVNELIGQRVSPEGPLRPTTTMPVVVVPGDSSQPAWADMLRTLRDANPEIHVVDNTPGTALDAAVVDLPAGLAAQMTLELVDVAIVVTTPGRYGDASTWELIDNVVRHGIECIVVLNRASGPDDEVAVDLGARLGAEGLDLRVISVATDGDVGPLRAAVTEVASGDPQRRTSDVVGAVATRLDALAEGVGQRVQDERTLVEVVDRVSSATAEEMRRSIEERPMPGAADRPWSETSERLADIVTHRIGDAASVIAGEWSLHPLGVDMLGDHGEVLWRHPADASVVASQALLGWPAAVERLVVADAKRNLRPIVQDSVVEVVSDRALGGSKQASRRLNRKLKSGIDEVGLRARTALADIAGDLVIADRMRYLERLSGGPEPSLSDLLRDAATRLRAAAPPLSSPNSLDVDRGAEPGSETSDAPTVEDHDA